MENLHNDTWRKGGEKASGGKPKVYLIAPEDGKNDAITPKGGRLATTCLHALHKNAESLPTNLWGALYSTVHHSPGTAQPKKQSRWHGK